MLIICVNYSRDADWDVVCLRWVVQRTQYCKYASWQSSDKGLGKVPKPIPASLWDTPARKLGSALSRMASRQNRVTDEASHLRKQQNARSHSVHWWISHQRPVSVGLQCQARCDHHWSNAAYTVSTPSLTMEVEAVTLALCWAASKGDSRTSLILTDSMSLLLKVKSVPLFPNTTTIVFALPFAL